MKTIITGCRSCGSMALVQRVVDNSTYTVTEVVCGKGNGNMDRFVRAWAEHNNIPLKLFTTDWLKHYNRASTRRNAEMVAYAGQLIVAMRGKSRVLSDLIRRANNKGIPVFIYQGADENVIVR